MLRKMVRVCRFGVSRHRATSVRVVHHRRVVLAAVLQRPAVLLVALPLWHFLGL